jgi:hypothetical protein
MDSVEHIGELSAVGAALGRKVKKEDFEGFLDG